MTKEEALFKEIALRTVPRVLGFGDRKDDSPTFGCFDRHYWHYKLTDFPCANFQEAAYLLALLYTVVKDTPYYENAEVARWARSAIRFWLASRNKDGSVNEAYPFERSFCATAFTAAAISEAMLLLGWEYSGELEESAAWLSKHDNPELSNQRAAAAVALYNAFLLSGENRFKEAARRKTVFLLEACSRAGFFPEYGGRDCGYLSLTVWYLYKYYQKSKEEDVMVFIRQAVRCLEENILDHGAVDSEKESRRTQYIYPYPAVLLSGKIKEIYLKGLSQNLVITPEWLDDRYCMHLLINYLEAACC